MEKRRLSADFFVDLFNVDIKEAVELTITSIHNTFPCSVDNIVMICCYYQKRFYTRETMRGIRISRLAEVPPFS